jgi:hypothetical protein
MVNNVQILKKEMEANKASATLLQKHMNAQVVDEGTVSSNSNVRSPVLNFFHCKF